MSKFENTNDYLIIMNELFDLTYKISDNDDLNNKIKNFVVEC